MPLYLFDMIWFLKKGYLQGAFWAIMINVVSSGNDVLMKFVGQNMHWLEVSFFRYLFSMLLILPLMFRIKEKNLFHTAQPVNHIWRALFGVVGLTACCLAVNYMPFSQNTAITMTQPFFFLILAYFFLKESVNWKRWLSTIVGFLGLMVILQPGTDTFQWVGLVPVLGAISFASLDLFAKKMVVNEHMYTMLFYFGLGTTILAGIPLFFVWQTPTLTELAYLFALGLGANLIQVCIFRAFSATDASGLMPFRYVEFLTASIAQFVFFNIIPSNQTYIGAAIIIASAIFLTIQEHKTQKQKALMDDQTEDNVIKAEFGSSDEVASAVVGETI